MRIRALVLVVALMLGVAACGSDKATPQPPAGPLRVADAEGQLSDDLAWSVGIPVDTGGQAGVSIGLLYNTGADTIRITSVTLVGANGVTLAGTRVATLPDADSGVTLGGDTFAEFPPDHDLGPLDDAIGFELPSTGRGTEVAGSSPVFMLIVGYHATTRGHADAVDVSYDAGGKSWTLRVPVAVTLCPPGDTTGDCPAGGS